MERKLGRPLGSSEVVHHIDWNPLNNSPENPTVVTRSEHMRLHQKGQRKRFWSREETDRAVELYESGLNVDEVARALRRPYSSTRRVLQARGVLRRPSETKHLKRQQNGS